MSFYDPKKHAAVSDPTRFRSKVHQRQQRQGSSNKPMTGFRYSNRFKPPINDRTWIRLIPEPHASFSGEMQNFFEYVEHYNATTRRGTICSKIWKEGPDGLVGSGKCIPCHEIDNGAKNIGFRQLGAFLLIHLDWYYEVQRVNEKGELLTYTRDSKYHKNGDPLITRVWNEADESTLKYHQITRRQLRDCKKVFGNLMHWSMGSKHMGALSSKVFDLESKCYCGGELTVPAYECRKCEHILIDVEKNDRDLTRKQINEMALNEQKCPNCGEVDTPQPLRDCSNDCDEPDCLKIWDVDLEVGRQGEGTDSMIIVYNHRYEDLDERIDEKLLPESPLLHRIFAGDDLKWQAKTMNVANPFIEVDRHTRDYVDKEKGSSSVDEDDLPF